MFFVYKKDIQCPDSQAHLLPPFFFSSPCREGGCIELAPHDIIIYMGNYYLPALNPAPLSAPLVHKKKNTPHLRGLLQ